MVPRLAIIIAGALAVVALAAVLLLRAASEHPRPGTADESAGSPAVARARSLVPDPDRERLSDSGRPVDELATKSRWSACGTLTRDRWPAVLDGLGEGRTPPLVETLAASGSAEHVLAGALLRPDSEPDAIRADIERALALDRDHPLVLWHAEDLCGRGSGASHCETADFERRLSETLHSNGAFWVRRAVRHMEQGSERAALGDVRRAAAASGYDSYWSQRIVLFDRALAVAGGLSHAERIMTAVSVASAIGGPGYKLFGLCRDRSVDDSLWMDACTNLATRVAADSRTLIDKAISYGLLENLYEQSGRDDAARFAAGKRAELEALLTADPDTAHALLADDRFGARWLDELVVNGEVAAIRFALSEIERLKADPDYDPCALIVR